MRNTRRADRVSEAIREVVATFLAEGGGAKDPRITGLVTVTGVDITSDLRHAKVFVSVLGTETEKAATFDGLNSVAGHLRSQIAKALQLRVAPQITFKVDESVAHAARIESLLEQIKHDTPARADDEERQP
ncbi:MAG: 30S ribosome-binding factor RbfA [Gemmatimonadaceae bacterium]|nr:30S ribosome-binding factor RbfA [Gemmatimonadaceae bacterium]